MNEVEGSKERGVPPVRSERAATSMTRRQLLAGTGQLAVLALLPTACAPVTNAPWADGTFWDDGKGWTA